ncbi:hypothetical protein KKH43_05070 [Patescibacteria group bacterium]|nr:hypothetical protein [Patescibacteria group bacterium]
MEEKLTSNLRDLGLTNNEALMYLALLSMDHGSVASISKAAGLNRTTGYDVLRRLSINGIVNQVIVGKKKTYKASPPVRLKQLFENKKRQAERRLADLAEYMPELKALYKTELKPVIRFAEGKEEMSTMYMHKLDAKSTIYSILNLKGYSEDFDIMGSVSSIERYKRGIKENVLALRNKTSLKWWGKEYEGKPKRQKNTEYRWIDKSMKEYPNGEVNIYDDTVIIMLTKPGEYVAFEIESKSLAAFLKIVFELAWEQAKKLQLP